MKTLKVHVARHLRRHLLLNSHPFGAGFLSCEERRSQRAAEIMILPAISFRPNLFVFARCLSSSFVPFKHDAIPDFAGSEERGFIGVAPPPALKLMPEWRLFCGAHKRRAQRHTDSENVWNPDTADAFATKGRRASD